MSLTETPNTLSFRIRDTQTDNSFIYALNPCQIGSFDLLYMDDHLSTLSQSIVNPTITRTTTNKSTPMIKKVVSTPVVQSAPTLIKERSASTNDKTKKTEPVKLKNTEPVKPKTAESVKQKKVDPIESKKAESMVTVVKKSNIVKKNSVQEKTDEVEVDPMTSQQKMDLDRMFDDDNDMNMDTIDNNNDDTPTIDDIIEDTPTVDGVTEDTPTQETQQVERRVKVTKQVTRMDGKYMSMSRVHYQLTLETEDVVTYETVIEEQVIPVTKRPFKKVEPKSEVKETKKKQKANDNHKQGSILNYFKKK